MPSIGRDGPRTVSASLGTSEKNKANYVLVNLVSTLRICFNDEEGRECRDTGTKLRFMQVTVTQG